LLAEIQAYIISLEASQYFIDRHESKPWREYCNGIETFGKVQAARGLGPIKVKLEKCLLKYCPKGRIPGIENRHLIVSAFYTDRENIKREVFLGYGYNNAYYRMENVKSTLLFLD